MSDETSRPADGTSAASEPRIDDLDSEGVDHGSRRADVYYEADPDQVVRIRHTFPDADPAPRDEQTNGPPGGPQEGAPETAPVDARVTPSESSAWDASPPEDETD